MIGECTNQEGILKIEEYQGALLISPCTHVKSNAVRIAEVFMAMFIVPIPLEVGVVSPSRPGPRRSLILLSSLRENIFGVVEDTTVVSDKLTHRKH